MKNPSWLITLSKANFSKTLGCYSQLGKIHMLYVGIGQDLISFVIFEEL